MHLFAISRMLIYYHARIYSDLWRFRNSEGSSFQRGSSEAPNYKKGAQWGVQYKRDTTMGSTVQTGYSPARLTHRVGAVMGALTMMSE